MKKFYDKGIQFECQGTGRCCVSRGSYGFVYLTLEDRRRLASHFGLKTNQFTRRYCRKAEGYYYLKSEGQACRYLNGKQCGVYEARPLQCRTWPFWPENMNAKTWKEVKAFCPGVGKGKKYSPKEIDLILRELEE